MEHAMRGQMGQPAACMMENKWSLRASEILADYGAGKPICQRVLEIYSGLLTIVKRKTFRKFYC